MTVRTLVTGFAIIFLATLVLMTAIPLRYAFHSLTAWAKLFPALSWRLMNRLYSESCFLGVLLLASCVMFALSLSISLRRFAVLAAAALAVFTDFFLTAAIPFLSVIAFFFSCFSPLRSVRISLLILFVGTFVAIKTIRQLSLFISCLFSPCLFSIYGPSLAMGWTFALFPDANGTRGMGFEPMLL
ncbi:Uncharacterised protein [uncultured archaeon]|nr:Uncharacterised protein [uncultured archaeon]